MIVVEIVDFNAITTVYYSEDQLRQCSFVSRNYLYDSKGNVSDAVQQM